MIKNIVFDIGNVCVDFCYRDFFESFGFSEEITKRQSERDIMRYNIRQGKMCSEKWKKWEYKKTRGE